MNLSRRGLFRMLLGAPVAAMLPKVAALVGKPTGAHFDVVMYDDVMFHVSDYVPPALSVRHQEMQKLAEAWVKSTDGAFMRALYQGKEWEP